MADTAAARAADAGRVLVVGGGLAGTEAAWQIARRAIPVTLMEMRPTRSTPAHRSDRLAELVCSNSLRGDDPASAAGLLKREMEELGSLTMRVARATAVPAGAALAVDRESFAGAMTAAIVGHPLIRVVREEVEILPPGPAVLATGPLTSAGLHRALEGFLGEGALSFYDALAPILAAESLDMGRLFRASRRGHGGEDYLNAALDQTQYEAFVDRLLAAERVAYRNFEIRDMRFFEGCLPIEVMAERGRDTLRFGPMKPVGLIDPASGRRPWAVVQLRQDDLAAEHWNMVGFQTKLKQAQQEQVFRTIPGLEQGRFVRFGSVHRNTFLNAPLHLDALLRLKLRRDLWVAGQLSGVEGYVESAAAGLMVGLNVAAELSGGAPTPAPPETALGGLVRHLTARSPERFEPSKISWGLIHCPPGLCSVRQRRQRRLLQGELALRRVREWCESLRLPPVA